MTTNPDWFAGLPERLQPFAGLQAEIDPAAMGDQLKRENNELRAEIARLRDSLVSEPVRYPGELGVLRAEVERLGDALAVSEGQTADAEELWSECRREVERLKADPYKAGYIDGDHAAHAQRNVSYRDCPRCSWQT